MQTPTDYTYWYIFGLHVIACSLFAYIDNHFIEIQQYVSQLYNKYMENLVNSYGLTALTYYSVCKNKLSNLTVSIYKCHPYITYSVDVCIYGYQYIRSAYHEYPIEPFQTQWISQNHTVMVGIEQPAYQLKNMETYDILRCMDSRMNAPIFIRNFNNDSFSLNQIQLNCITNERLLYARFNNIYVSRVQLSDSIILRSVNEFTCPSKVAFLSVSLSINQKKYNIDMDKKWMYVNNHLFSKTFLKRYLDYHNIKIRFTNDYVVNLMDNNINMFQLKPGEYIQLNTNDYTIQKTSK